MTEDHHNKTLSRDLQITVYVIGESYLIDAVGNTECHSPQNPNRVITCAASPPNLTGYGLTCNPDSKFQSGISVLLFSSAVSI